MSSTYKEPSRSPAHTTFLWKQKDNKYMPPMQVLVVLLKSQRLQQEMILKCSKAGRGDQNRNAFLTWHIASRNRTKINSLPKTVHLCKQNCQVSHTANDSGTTLDLPKQQPGRCWQVCKGSKMLADTKEMELWDPELLTGTSLQM